MKANKSIDPINIKIISELLAFYMHRGATDVDINLKEEKDKVTICISALISTINQDEFDSIIKLLNNPRQHELESYYWQLSGEDEDNDLSLVGVMIDNVEYKYEKDTLTLIITRSKQRS